MAATDSVRVKTDDLPVGSRLSHPINDDESRLLLAAGAPITAKIKERLIHRGIVNVYLHPDDAAALLGKKKQQQSSETAKQPPAKKKRKRPPKVTPTPRPAPSVAEIKAKVTALASSASMLVKSAGTRLNERSLARGCTSYDAKQRQRLSQHFSTTTTLIDAMVRQAITGQLQDPRPLGWSAENYATEMADDTDNVITSSIELAQNPEINERGVRLAILGMAIAMEMGWVEENVRQIGLCGLVHDWGMFRLNEQLQDPHNPISSENWSELVNHPFYTVELLDSMGSIPMGVRLAAAQVHENPDGSGYPQGLSGDDIHPFAKILHVADAYISLTAEMRGRQAYFAYDVMVYLLNQVTLERIDGQVMRAMLNVVSLFPIGSHVRLSDGTEAQVLRRSPQQYMKPIVQRVGADRKVRIDAAHTSIIDLSRTDLRIAAPLSPPDRSEQRLDKSLMDAILWDGIDE